MDLEILTDFNTIPFFKYAYAITGLIILGLLGALISWVFWKMHKDF